jgi:hypothetical protein
LLAEPALDATSETRQAYSKMAAAQAGLLAEHQFNAEAEQAYWLAIEMSPGNAESVYRLGKLLSDMGRKDEARDLFDNFVPKPR